MSKLIRSNSHDNISLNPISSFIHSQPTNHGAGQTSFGTRDDGPSLNNRIVSSPYQNACSALAVRLK